MKLKYNLILSSLFLLAFASCSKEDSVEDSGSDPVTITEDDELEVERFVYNGLNEIYLYKADVPELADNYFSSSSAKTQFLADANSPEALFDNLIAPFDRFSFITDDYSSLEDRFEGMSGATGIKFGVGQISGTGNVFGIIRYVLPNTSASEAGLERGNIFTEIDGQRLTSSNFSRLIEKESFTINVGYVEDNQIMLTDREVTLTDDTYTENPIYISKTFDIGGRTIGYLMYNSFIAGFDDDLNNVFADFISEGVTDLILDLRYNGGGSVESAKDLSSMITGQFNDEVFIKEQWNEKYQRYYENQNPEALVNRFDNTLRTGTAINSLNFSEVYVLTSRSSASASELIINGLDPYINVIQVGDQTVGKFQASVTLYDSDDYSKEGASDNHKYAMQPLVFKSINSVGTSDYVNGLEPEIVYVENLNDFGVLGEPDEPLLERAINTILGRSMESKSSVARLDYKVLGESGMNNPEFQRMYINTIPTIER